MTTIDKLVAEAIQRAYDQGYEAGKKIVGYKGADWIAPHGLPESTPFDPQTQQEDDADMTAYGSDLYDDVIAKIKFERLNRAQQYDQLRRVAHEALEQPLAIVGEETTGQRVGNNWLHTRFGPFIRKDCVLGALQYGTACEDRTLDDIISKLRAGGNAKMMHCIPGDDDESSQLPASVWIKPEGDGWWLGNKDSEGAVEYVPRAKSTGRPYVDYSLRWHRDGEVMRSDEGYRVEPVAGDVHNAYTSAGYCIMRNAPTAGEAMDACERHYLQMKAGQQNASVKRATSERTLEWKHYPLSGVYGAQNDDYLVQQVPTGWRAEYKGLVLSVTATLDSAKLDCEEHFNG